MHRPAVGQQLAAEAGYDPGVVRLGETRLGRCAGVAGGGAGEAEPEGVVPAPGVLVVAALKAPEKGAGSARPAAPLVADFSGSDAPSAPATAERSFPSESAPSAAPGRSPTTSAAAAALAAIAGVASGIAFPPPPVPPRPGRGLGLPKFSPCEGAPRKPA